MTIGFARLKGEGAALPPRASWRAIALAWLGGCLAIGTVAGLADGLSMTLVLSLLLRWYRHRLGLQDAV